MRTYRYEADPTVLVLAADESINEMRRGPLIDRAEEGVAMVVVDCGGLEFLGSGGIGNILHLQKHLGESGVEVRLAGLAEDQAEILRITRVTTLIGMYAGVDEAVRGEDRQE